MIRAVKSEWGTYTPLSELAFSPNDNTVHIHKKAGNKWEKGFVLAEVSMGSKSYSI